MFTTNHIDSSESRLVLPAPHFLRKYLNEKAAIEKNYDFLNCTITSKGLICKGTFFVPETAQEYEIKIEYSIPKHPRVYVIKPIIEYNSDIHMYKDGTLCLYYPGDKSWTAKSLLFDTIIPWTAEWLIFYELYKINGEWLGKYKPH